MANPKFKGQRAEIRKTKSKDKPFNVRYVGKNGEPLAPSQPVTTKHNARKNIAAMVTLANGTHMMVVDLTGATAEKYLVTDKGEILE